LSTSSSPSTRRPSPCFDDDTKEANVRAIVDVADGHANVRASAVMTDNDNDNVAHDGDFPDTLRKIPSATFGAADAL